MVIHKFNGFFHQDFSLGVHETFLRYLATLLEIIVSNFREQQTFLELTAGTPDDSPVAPHPVIVHKVPALKSTSERGKQAGRTRALNFIGCFKRISTIS